MKRKFITLVLSTFWVFGLAQCGDVAGLSKKVNFNVTNESPIVIDSDATFVDANGDENTVEGPWFRTGFRITNSSSRDLWIATVRIESSSANVAFDETIDPSLTCEDGGTSLGTRFYLVQLYAGDTFTGMDPTSDGCNRADPIDGTAEYTDDVTEEWFIGGLPENGTNNFNYSFTATPEGFFVNDSGTAVERLQVTAFITTQ